jgi:hypothetical protein
MTAANTSFGVIVHGARDLSDGYLVLVNAYGERGGSIRIFRAPVWPQRTDMRLIAQRSVTVERGIWLRLGISTSGSDAKRATFHVRLSPADGVDAAAPKGQELTGEDTDSPLPGPGVTGIRFFSADPGNKTFLRSLSIAAHAPAPKVAR